MLVLTRRAGESIVIGDGIKITVVNVGPGRVKIGIEAPPSVRVDRAEVHSRIQQEQATDVLAAVTATALANNTADQPTMVSSGPETNVIPAETSAQSGTPNAPVARLSEFRAHRKPR